MVWRSGEGGKRDVRFWIRHGYPVSLRLVLVSGFRVMFGQVKAWLYGIGAAVVFGIGAWLYGKGRMDANRRNAERADRDYRETRQEIDGLDLGHGATDSERIEQLRGIAERRGGDS